MPCSKTVIAVAISSLFSTSLLAEVAAEEAAKICHNWML